MRRDKEKNAPFFAEAKGHSAPKSYLAARRSACTATLAALFPLLLFAIWQFGPRAFSIFLISCLFAVLFDFPCGKITKDFQNYKEWDFSSLLSGALLGLLYPITVPLWLPVVGSLLMVTILRLYAAAKKKFDRFPLPPLSHTAFSAFVLMLFFEDFATVTGLAEKAGLFSTSASLTGMSGADPLALLKNGTLPEGMKLTDFLLGTHIGRPGCVSAALLFCALLFLLLRRDITWHIPAAFVGSVAFVTFLFPKVGGRMTDGLLFNERLDFMFGEVFGGGLLFAAIFLSTASEIAPLTTFGRLFFGIGCGGITLLIRYFTPAVDGCFLAITVMGLFRDPIDRFALSLHYPKQKNNAARGEKNVFKNI